MWLSPADHYQHEQMLIWIRGPATSSPSRRTVGGVKRLPRYLKCAAASKAFSNERWKYFHVDLSSHRQINLVASGGGWGGFSGWLSGLVSRCHRNRFRDRLNGWLGINWSPLCHFRIYFPVLILRFLSIELPWKGIEMIEKMQLFRYDKESSCHNLTWF